MLVLIAWAVQEEVDTSWQWTIIGGLMVGLLSKLPFYFYIPVYLIIIGLVRFIKNRFWQAPLIAMFITTVAGTIFVQFATLAVLQLTGTPLKLVKSIGYVILPSILLNILLSIPLYAIVTDFAQTVYRSQRKNEPI